MSNEIILFQILYRHVEYILFSFMKVRMLKFIQCGDVLSMAQNSQRFHFLKFFTLHLVFVTLKCTLVPKVFVVRILGQKQLFKHSL